MIAMCSVCTARDADVVCADWRTDHELLQRVASEAGADRATAIQRSLVGDPCVHTRAGSLRPLNTAITKLTWHLSPRPSSQVGTLDYFLSASMQQSARGRLADWLWGGGGERVCPCVEIHHRVFVKLKFTVSVLCTLREYLHNFVVGFFKSRCISLI